MREKINRLAKGIIDAEIPELVLRPQEINEAVPAGQITKKSLAVADKEGLFIKGLVYSSSPRVRVCDNAFGGVRNSLSYEVDSTWLTAADTIAGAFYLVTNGGEYKVPYRFSVEPGVSGRTLQSLTTPQAFAGLAVKDLETALRLFEYQDFVEAPFMQDLHVRALYDGLKGRPNRQNQLEEFLVALGAKEPVEISLDESERSYEDLTQPLGDELEVRADHWGYVRFEVMADGDFLELPQKSFDSRDFQDGLCRVPFIVNPARLHGGRNMGALTVRTVRSALTVRVEAQGKDEELHIEAARREDMSKYFGLRLEYEIGTYEDRLLINQMRQELEVLCRQQGQTLMLNLLSAELCLLDGQKERALAILEGCRAEVTEIRMDKPAYYCGYQYLMQIIQKKDGQRETLLRLVKKYLEENPRSGFLFLLWLKLEPSAEERPEELLAAMRDLFVHGNCSPFLYARALRLYGRIPELLQKVGPFEQQVLMFGARRELLERTLALRAAQLMAVKKQYSKLSLRLLEMLYGKYQEKPFLTAVCAMLIKGDCRDSRYFTWYETALKQGVSLTRLYEYYVYSLPRDYAYLLPKEVLLYFSYETDMDSYTRSVLYTNILKYMKPEASLYRQYERDIERFTMEQLLQSRINRRLVVLYQHMVYPEMVDTQVAKVLPALLKSYRVRLKNPNMKYVIVCYEELEGEDAFPIRDGVAYVPLFVERAVLLFQDEYGNRYANIPYRKQPAMEQKNIRELEERCYEVYPDHPMLRLQECGEIVGAGISGEGDLMTLRRATEDLPLKLPYRRHMLSLMIRYHQDCLDRDDGLAVGDVGYLVSLDLEKLTRGERAGVCETLIQQEYIREAWEIIHKFGWEGIRPARLLKVCTRTILQQLFDEDDELLMLACELFSLGKYDSVVLDYLCEHFNGSGRQMYRILSQGVREHVELYDMPERLLAQMLFTGDTERSDQVFDWYLAGTRTGDQLVRAYFTMKSAAYFLQEKPTGDRVFAYLEGAVHSAPDIGRLPTIYLLALARYYATLPALDEERKKLCGKVMELLLSEGRVFAWYRELGRLIPLPDAVMDKAVVEYHSSRDAKPELLVRILPDEEDYHRGEMRRVYQGVFVMQKVLFEGEILEYQIYETTGGTRTLTKEGSVAADPGQAAGSRRFAALNEMGLCLSMKEEEKLKAGMKKYLTDNAVMEELFPLM